MKAWIVGDSFGTPCLTTDIWAEGNTDYYNGILPDDSLVQGTEWVKQVVTNLGYEYSILFNLSHPGCSNDYIFHNVDWILNNESFDKEKDMIMIIPTNSSRFMYRSEQRGINKNIFKFVNNKTPHMSTAGSHETGDQVLDEFQAMYRDHDFEFYKSVSAYDKLLAFLTLYNIDYLFCPGFWVGHQLSVIPGYQPQFIDIEFPDYGIGMNADIEHFQHRHDRFFYMNKGMGEGDNIYWDQPISDLYSNHFTDVGNDAYASAVLDYIESKR